ncbi:hypothetical protein C2E23DRAFT_329789 [Lenzites betulinus]|nr:hypothetical protein C2E23DRAFT_329789 [Lenzites betulinus]
MENSVLPADVCYNIIDAVSGDDWSSDNRERLDTLRSCALTCTSWLGRARFRLYDSVSIEDDEEFRFITTVVNSPYLAPLVRRLQISMPLNDDWAEDTDSDSAMSTSGSPPPLPPALQHIQELVNLEELIFGFVLDTKFTRLLLPIVTSFASAPSLKKLTLFNLEFGRLQSLLLCLEPFTGLETLRLALCTWTAYEHTEDVRPLVALINLELLDSTFDPSFLGWMPATIETLLLARGETSESLGIVPSDYPALSRYSNLKSIVLEANMSSDTHWILQALTNLHSPALKELALRYTAFSDMSGGGFARTRLPIMDDMLSRAPLWSIQQVSIETWTSLTKNEDVGTVKEYLESQIRETLPRVRARGVRLEIKPHVFASNTHHAAPIEISR